MGNVMLSIKEAAAKANLSEAHVRQLLREGKITGMKVGKEWRITREALDSFLGIKTDTESLKKDLYIKELEGRVKNYEIRMSTIKNIVGTLENILGS